MKKKIIKTSLAFRRLMTLARFLRKVPAQRFQMTSYYRGKFCGRLEELRHNECGSSACALGWATFIPAFKKAGLRFERDSSEQPSVPVYENNYGVRAGEIFFRIDYDSADLLFGGSLPDDPNIVADAIEKVAGKYRLKSR